MLAEDEIAGAPAVPEIVQIDGDSEEEQQEDAQSVAELMLSVQSGTASLLAEVERSTEAAQEVEALLKEAWGAALVTPEYGPKLRIRPFHGTGAHWYCL